MKLSIIIIGDEILLGQVTDTNSGAIARAFGPLGFSVAGIRTVADDADAIRRAVAEAMATSELTVTTGGLGPTKDDITKLTLRDIFGGEMRRDPQVTANIERVFAARGLKMNEITADQALVPDSCRVIQNRLGTAPIMWFERDGHVVVSMPGVPFETEGALPELTEQVRKCFTPDLRLFHHTFIVHGITESDLSDSLEGFEAGLAHGLHLAYLPDSGIIRLRLDGVGDDALAPKFEEACARIRRELGPLLIHDGDATPAEIVLEAVRARGLSLGTAESCTGGNIARSITLIPGASDIFYGGVVSYANSVKIDVLGVDRADLEAHGAVSREVVEQMAAGACRVLGVRCAVATSGIAGPGGGTPDKPVGTVWMGWCVDGRVASEVRRFPGDRARVITRATNEALLGLLKLL